MPYARAKAHTLARRTGAGNDARTIAEQRVRAARILVGLRRQGSFKDLQGPRPAGPGKR